jgi:TPR repeat protein
MRIIWMIIVCMAALMAWVLPASAHLKYYSDPAYRKLNEDDHHPMDEMIDLAKQGDVRAQFILGDMYQKGKGGLVQDAREARRWFGESAVHGYSQSFIRLAALSKHAGKPVEAWQWYTLAIENLDDDTQQYAIKARNDLTESAQLTREEMDHARDSIKAWKEARREQLRNERDNKEQTPEEKLAATGKKEKTNE